MDYIVQTYSQGTVADSKVGCVISFVYKRGTIAIECIKWQLAMAHFDFVYETKRNESKSMIEWNISIIQIEMTDFILIRLFLLHTGDIL
jgi:hypothetical protein